MEESEVSTCTYLFFKTKYVKPACLPNKAFTPNSKCYVSGWGTKTHFEIVEKVTDVVKEGDEVFKRPAPTLRKKLEDRELHDRILLLKKSLKIKL